MIVRPCKSNDFLLKEPLFLSNKAYLVYIFTSGLSNDGIENQYINTNIDLYSIYSNKKEHILNLHLQM